MHNTLAMYENIIPLLAPVDNAGTAVATPFIDLKTAHNAAFLVYCGVITAGTADAVVTITVEAATAAASGSEAAIGFTYRKSGIAAANTWDAAAAATSTGATFGSTDDGKMMLVELDPAAVQAAKTDGRYVRLVFTPTDFTVSLATVIGIIAPRYAQTTMVSAT